MNTAILIGSAFGTAAGLLHAAGLARRIVARSGFKFPGFTLGRTWTALYYGLWAILLWTVFGAYVLYLWLIACGVFGLHRLWRSRLTAGRH